MLKEIKQIHDYHQYHNLKTALTCATYVAPLNYLNFRPWTQSGFTLTAWLQIKPGNYASVASDNSIPTAGDSSSDPSVEKSIPKKNSKICSMDEKVI